MAKKNACWPPSGTQWPPSACTMRPPSACTQKPRPPREHHGSTTPKAESKPRAPPQKHDGTAPTARAPARRAQASQSAGINSKPKHCRRLNSRLNAFGHGDRAPSGGNARSVGMCGGRRGADACARPAEWRRRRKLIKPRRARRGRRINGGRAQRARTTPPPDNRRAHISAAGRSGAASSEGRFASLRRRAPLMEAAPY